LKPSQHAWRSTNDGSSSRPWTVDKRTAAIIRSQFTSRVTRADRNRFGMKNRAVIVSSVGHRARKSERPLMSITNK
jgi:hypothetical protein